MTTTSWRRTGACLAISTVMLAALAGCDRRPADTPTPSTSSSTSSTPSSTTSPGAMSPSSPASDASTMPMPSASAASS